MQVKLFWVQAPMEGKGFIVRNNGANGSEFEGRINAWLAENPDVDIRYIKQSASGASLLPALWLVSVWYSVADA